MKRLATILTFSLLLFIELAFSACSSAPRYTKEEWDALMNPPNINVYTTKRNKNSDKSMRIMVAPNKRISPVNRSEIQILLVQQDKWNVVDRGTGFKAVLKEQDLQHLDLSERMDNKQKWAHWGKLHGVGAIIIPDGSCEDMTERGFLGTRQLKDRVWCDASLTMVDANTGEIIVAVSGEMKVTPGRAGNWEPLVRHLAEAYPENFQADQKYKNIVDYENESEKNAEMKKLE